MKAVLLDLLRKIAIGCNGVPFMMLFHIGIHPICVQEYSDFKLAHRIINSSASSISARRGGWRAWVGTEEQAPSQLHT
ncbi:MAG TPA: hypothetical protein VMA74_09235 [Dyella sp.]|nr:hypothetical protein [Dyella sp.]